MIGLVLAIAVASVDAGACEPGEGALRVVVTASDALPVPGAAIGVSGRDGATLTDAEGRASLCLSPGAQWVAVALAGFKSESLKLQVAPGKEITKRVALQVAFVCTVTVTELGPRSDCICDPLVDHFGCTTGPAVIGGGYRFCGEDLDRIAH